MKKHIYIIFLLLIIVFTGCATNRGILNIKIEAPAAQTGSKAVKIASIVDRRIFELKPPKPSIPSLRNGEINNESIKSRAIARKRNTYGKAMGDILLPENRTVSDLVEEVLIKSLHESGYSVLKEGDPGYNEAGEIRVIINKFWAWFTPGFWKITLDFQAEIELSGNIISESQIIHGSSHIKSSSAKTRAWIKVFTEGIQNLIENLKKLFSNK